MKSIFRHLNAMLVHLLVGLAFICAAIFLTLGTGCTTAPTQQQLQAQLSAFCAVAPNEVNAFIAGKAALSTTAQNALPTVQAFVTMECAPGVVADATSLQNFAIDILPAFTTIALEYAASKKTGN